MPQQAYPAAGAEPSQSLGFWLLASGTRAHSGGTDAATQAAGRRASAAVVAQDPSDQLRAPPARAAGASGAAVPSPSSARGAVSVAAPPAAPGVVLAAGGCELSAVHTLFAKDTALIFLKASAADLFPDYQAGDTMEATLVLYDGREMKLSLCKAKTMKGRLKSITGWKEVFDAAGLEMGQEFGAFLALNTHFTSRPTNNNLASKGVFRRSGHL